MRWHNMADNPFISFHHDGKITRDNPDGTVELLADIAEDEMALPNKVEFADSPRTFDPVSASSPVTSIVLEVRRD